MHEVVGIGIDLVDCGRIERMLADHGQAFLDRVYTPGEQAYCGRSRNQIERLAARYAAKEAVLKALGTGMRDGMSWTEIEVRHDALGAPVVTLHGEVARVAAARGVGRLAVSLTHAGGLAMAEVMALGTAG
ncbi:MAG: Holo-[acyl-carrier-protein] synthase [Planctomycetota bacterium]|jgi:holo-[acyl-carrier protein] synthase